MNWSSRDGNYNTWKRVYCVWLTKRLDSSAEKISETEDSNRNYLKWNTVRKKAKRNEQSIGEPWDNLDWPNTW